MQMQFVSAMLVAFLALSTDAQTPEPKKPDVGRDLGNDQYAAGCPVRIDKLVGGDAFLAGCSIDVDAAISGDVLVAGGNVHIGAPIGQTLYAAAGQLRINASIGRNARVAGGQIEFAPKSQVGGNITVGGGNVRVRGAVKGYVSATGGNVLIDGPIEGDVVATGGAIELGPNARINGRLRYTSRDEILRDPAAQVLAGVDRMPERRTRMMGRHGGWAWSLGLMLIAAVAVAAMPALTRRVTDTWRQRFGMSLLFGFIVLVCVPAAALILLITIVGAPLALAVVALYLALLIAGYVSTGIGVGDWALARLKSDRAASRGWRIGAAALGMLVISACGRLPYVGTLLVFLALLIGLGALVLQVRRETSAP